MKRILSLLILTVLVVASCSKYDDTELQRRVSALEAYQSLLQKLDSGKPVTSYSQSGTDVTFNFGDGTSITIDNKPSAENPIKTITADGNTLTITLADGTVVPVTYGEKEGYGLEIANGRKCFSVLESLESIYARRVTIPYTLTGNITNPEDVQIETRVSSYQDIVTGYDIAKVEKTDAKNGNILVHMREDYSNTGWDGGEFYCEFPEIVLEVTAHFPDGTSSYQKLFVVGFRYYMETDEDYWDLAYVTDYDPEVKMPVIHLPKEAGEFYFIMRIGTTSYTSTYFWDLYDGASLTAYQFSDVFYKVDRIADSNGYFLGVTENPEPTVKTYTHEWDAVYTVKITFTRNSLSRDRYNDLQFWKKESASSSGGLTRIRLIQAH